MLFLTRMLRRTGQHSVWLLPVLIAGFVFVTSWVLMYLAQPESGLVAPENFWWWFLITTTTVGYGDFFPQTFAGKLVGAYVVAGGLTTITVVVSRIADAIDNLRGRRMQGRIDFDGSDHLVVLGHAPGRTDALVGTLLEDDTDRDIVLCAWPDQAGEHPLSSEPRVHFVRGDLADTAVLRRAGADRARAILVDARDDNEAVTLTVAAAEAAPETHTVVALRDLAAARTVARVDSGAQCVQWHATQMITEELEDPGISRVYAELTTPGGSSTFSTVVPSSAKEATYGDWQSALGQRHSSTLLAVQHGDGLQVSGPWESPVPPGSRLYYVNDRRLEPEDLARAIG